MSDSSTDNPLKSGSAGTGLKGMHIPLNVVGPGSQPLDPDGLKSDFQDMPDEMMTYRAPVVPEPEETDGLAAGLSRAQELLAELCDYSAGDPARVIELDDLDEANRDFLSQMLGEGEVSVQYNGDTRALIQESVLAGVWRIQYIDAGQRALRDTVEVGDVPSLVRTHTFTGAAQQLDLSNLEVPDTVYNATPLLAEIRDKLAEQTPGGDPHVINLSLLPHTEADLAFLSDTLGIGPLIILSRGYGNCRISSSGTRNVWWVQYFNSQETLILNTIELSEVPEVARAAKEDLLESAERLREILSVYQ